MTGFLQMANRFVWGAPALVLILGTGVFLSVRTRFVQLTLLPRACRHFWRRLWGERGNGSYRALCTALAATVGTGNIAGVAGAIAIGGPGAIFWMWICAVLGMMTKFAEATLAVRYRIQNAQAEYVGGPMYMIRLGLGKRWTGLAFAYSFLGVVAALGVGNATQINAVVTSVSQVLSAFEIHQGRYWNLIIGLLFGGVVTLMFLGGAGRIGAAAEQLVPFASAVYIFLSAGALIARWQQIPAALDSIVRGAFCPSAVTGGLIGSFFGALRVGVSRGVFTNEAGMGTASIAHAGAQVRQPAEQGLMGIMEVFLDTIVICTMTALVILCSGTPISYGEDTGAVLTTQAFSAIYGNWVSVVIALCLFCFAFATILGWGLYGARCAQFLFGTAAWRAFAVVQGVVVVLGAVLETDTVWIISELFNGLMAIPNLIVLTALSPELVRLTKEYRSNTGSKTAAGGTYENLNQCKSLRTLSYAEIPSACQSGGKTR